MAMGIVSTPIPMFPFNKWMMVSVFLQFLDALASLKTMLDIK